MYEVHMDILLILLEIKMIRSSDNYCYVLAQAACYYLLQICLAVLNEMFSNIKKKREKIEKKVR